jgi:hypothetical protein
MKFTLVTITIIVIGLLVLSLAPVQAALGDPIIPEGCDKVNESGQIVSKCEIGHFIQLFVNITEWILAMTGAVALAMFVYGGITWIISAGNPSRIKQGQQILINTVIAIIIILGAFTIVEFVGRLFGGGVLPANFNEYLDSSGSGGSVFCANDGDACMLNGQNVYACISGQCSGQNLCDYWREPSHNTNNPYGITTNHRCTPLSNCQTNTAHTNLCSGGASNVCCIPQ